jgi:hypothetical protein
MFGKALYDTIVESFCTAAREACDISHTSTLTQRNATVTAVRHLGIASTRTVDSTAVNTAYTTLFNLLNLKRRNATSCQCPLGSPGR